MSTKRFVLFLIAVGLCWLLPSAPPAFAINTPVTIQSCMQGPRNSNSSETCNLSNTTSGNTIVADYVITGSATTSSTETLSCPAGLSVNHNFGSYTITWVRCFVATTSSHATFAVTVNCSGGSVQNFMVREIQGLGAQDSSSDSTNFQTNSNPSTSTTTSSSNEWVDAFCFGGVNSTPGSGFAQNVLSTIVLTTSSPTGGILLAETQLVPTATTITSTCSVTGIDTTNGTAIIASGWAISGAPTPGTIKIIQQSTFGRNTTVIAGQGLLANTVSGHKIVILWSTFNNGQATVSFTCTEACTCPTGSQASGHQFIVGVCYADTTSSHSQFSFFETDASNDPISILGLEVAGLTTGADSGSAAEAVAQTVNYTTASANEWTVTATFDTSATVIAPGNSFLPSGRAYSSNIASNTWQGLGMYKTTSSSGSNTTSFTSANTAALIGTLSFGPSPVTSSGYPMVIKYRSDIPKARKIPWDRPRKQVLIETI